MTGYLSSSRSGHSRMQHLAATQQEEKSPTMKVSIITVAYNSASTIADTIESVLRQDYSDIEYVIVNGASTDNTIDIIKHYEPLFQGRMKWVSEKDNGIYDAMNKGIGLCTGDIVGILNSDDYFTSDDVITRIVPYFLDPERRIDAVYGDIHFISSDRPEKTVRYYSSRFFHPRWLRFGFMPAHPSFYLRRECYERYGGYRTDYQIGSDYEMMVRLFHKHKIKAEYVKMDFVTMRTGGLSTRNVNSRITLVKEDVRACRENGIYTNQFLVVLKFLFKIFEIRF